MKHKYWSKYGSRKRWIKTLKRYIYFCKKCGEYITEDTGCSNPFCPEHAPDCDCIKCRGNRFIGTGGVGYLSAQEIADITR
jgi:hypothetical protein